MQKYNTREEWLIEATGLLMHRFAAKAGVIIPSVKVSVGWPGGGGRKNAVIGQCWHKDAAADKVAHIFISPVLDDPSRVLDVLAHELVHAVDENASGHKGNFAKIAKAIGLTGKMTATVAGPDLTRHLKALTVILGDYPHGALLSPGDGADGPKKQGTRMLKVTCAETTEGDAYTVRMTRKWLDAYGTPKCPCHDARMIEA